MIEKETFKRTTYARTEDGEIGIIEKYEFYDGLANPYLIKLKGNDYECAYEKNPRISENINELIEEGDLLRFKLKGLKHEYITIVKKYHDSRKGEDWLLINGYKIEQVEILGIITREQYKYLEFKI